MFSDLSFVALVLFLYLTGSFTLVPTWWYHYPCDSYDAAKLSFSYYICLLAFLSSLSLFLCLLSIRPISYYRSLALAPSYFIYYFAFLSYFYNFFFADYKSSLTPSEVSSSCCSWFFFVFSAPFYFYISLIRSCRASIDCWFYRLALALAIP